MLITLRESKSHLKFNEFWNKSQNIALNLINVYKNVRAKNQMIQLTHKPDNEISRQLKWQKSERFCLKGLYTIIPHDKKAGEEFMPFTL